MCVGYIIGCELVTVILIAVISGRPVVIQYRPTNGLPEMVKSWGMTAASHINEQ
jgi:hypothetical protein